MAGRILGIVFIVSVIALLLGAIMCIEYFVHTPTFPTKQLPIGRALFLIGGASCLFFGVGRIICFLIEKGVFQ